MSTITKYYILLAFLFTLILAAWTNPGIEKHRLAVKKSFFEKYEGNPIMGALAAVYLDESLNRVVEQSVGVESYVFFSITVIKVEDGTFTTDGIGIFGHVFLFGNTQMRQ